MATKPTLPIILLMIVMMRARLFIEFHIHMSQIRARVHTQVIMCRGKQTFIMRNVTVISRFSPEKENEVLPCKAREVRERLSREVVKAL